MASADSVVTVVALLLVMAGLGYALVESFGERDAALSAVLFLGIVGCGAVVYVVGGDFLRSRRAE